MRLVAFFVQTSLGLFVEFLSWFFYDLKFEGLENLNQAKLPFIYVSNHKSWIDHFIIIAGSLRRRGVVPIHLIADDRIWRRPIVGTVVRLLGAYPARTGQGLEVSLAPQKEHLRRSECVGIYPEGGCVREKNVFGEPKVGAAYLAYTTGEAVFPLAIKGTENMSPRSLLLGRRKITLKFGQPFKISPETLGPGSRKEIIERGRKYIMGKIIQLYRSIPD